MPLAVAGSTLTRGTTNEALDLYPFFSLPQHFTQNQLEQTRWGSVERIFNCGLFLMVIECKLDKYLMRERH